ncbi:MAG: hypothetical protein WA446_09070 [Steroidobacteraceae bacterium]
MAGPPRPQRNNSPAGGVTGRNLSGTKPERSSVSGAATSGLLCMAIVGGAVLALLAAANHAAH